MPTKILEFKWSVSRGRDTYGYNICTLWIGGKRMARCNGGGYDMQGTVFGDWLAGAYRDRLLKLTQEFSGLTFHDPNFDPGKVVPEYAITFGRDEDKGKTIKQLEREGKSFGLERLRAAYQASSKLPTPRHVIPLIDGACGFEAVAQIARAIGLMLERIDCRADSKNLSPYRLTDAREL